MKNVAIICAALLVVGMVATASAADGVSKSTLAGMGFASASTLSDVDGMAVRGKGWKGGTSASVGGSSSAAYFNIESGVATDTNHYDASSKDKWGGKSLAKGNSNSSAGIVVTKTFGDHTFTKSTLIVSGGSAFAFAK